MSTTRRINIMQDFEARLKRGEITKKQYLTQKKAMLLEEQAEQEAVKSKTENRLSIIAREIAELEVKLEVETLESEE